MRSVNSIMLSEDAAPPFDPLLAPSSSYSSPCCRRLPSSTE